MLLGMRHVLKLTQHHPWTLSAALVLVSTMYTYARVLVLQFCLGALQHWIRRYPTNFPHSFFIPFYYISTTLAFFAAIAHDCLVLQSGLWKYVLPIPLTTSGRLYRVFGVPLYAFGIATMEAVQMFRNPNMESDLSRLAVYFRGLPEYAWLDDMKLRKLVTDIKWHAWSLQTTTSPTTAAYIRLPLELLVALVVCSVYGIAVFCKEPRHGMYSLGYHNTTVIAFTYLFASLSLGLWALMNPCRRRRASRRDDQQRPPSGEKHFVARREPEQQIGRWLDIAAYLRAAGTRWPRKGTAGAQSRPEYLRSPGLHGFALGRAAQTRRTVANEPIRHDSAAFTAWRRPSESRPERRDTALHSIEERE
ncbi:hypothetical protein FI667_g1253, partial [Globisporangium splendens]